MFHNSTAVFDVTINCHRTEILVNHDHHYTSFLHYYTNEYHEGIVHLIDSIDAIASYLTIVAALTMVIGLILTTKMYNVDSLIRTSEVIDTWVAGYVAGRSIKHIVHNRLSGKETLCPLTSSSARELWLAVVTGILAIVLYFVETRLEASATRRQVANICKLIAILAIAMDVLEICNTLVQYLYADELIIVEIIELLADIFFLGYSICSLKKLLVMKIIGQNPTIDFDRPSAF
ncbi:hypothetical protein CHUAL_004856 [Chamberlinius hualienensis]